MSTTNASVDCNLCGRNSVEVIFDQGVAQVSRIVRCRHCMLMYASPRAKAPDQEEVKDYDPDFIRASMQRDRGRYDKEEYQVRDYEATREYLREAYPSRGRLLEIGCSMGFLLTKFRDDGWDVEGIEPNRGLCQFVIEEHGIRATDVLLEDLSVPENTYDVVVLLHVIEHVPDPLSMLKSIQRVLKPGGTLVLETPRYDSLMFKLLGRRERSVSCDGHIYFFTTNTLKEIAIKSGFDVKSVQYVGRSMNVARLIWNFGVVSKSEAVQRVLGSVSRKLNLSARHLHLNVRDMQRALLVKPRMERSRT